MTTPATSVTTDSRARIIFVPSPTRSIFTIPRTTAPLVPLRIVPRRRATSQSYPRTRTATIATAKIVATNVKPVKSPTRPSCRAADPKRRFRPPSKRMNMRARAVK